MLFFFPCRAKGVFWFWRFALTHGFSIFYLLDQNIKYAPNHVMTGHPDGSERVGLIVRLVTFVGE